MRRARRGDADGNGLADLNVFYNDIALDRPTGTEYRMKNKYPIVHDITERSATGYWADNHTAIGRAGATEVTDWLERGVTIS